jgi:hypothetical protein
LYSVPLSQNFPSQNIIVSKSFTMPENTNTFKNITTGPNDDDHRVTSTDSNRLYQDIVPQANTETAPESLTESPHDETTEEAEPRINEYENVYAHEDSSQHIISTTSATIRAIDVTAQAGARQGLGQMNNQSVQAMFQSYSSLPAGGHTVRKTSVTTGQSFKGQGYRLAGDGITKSGAQR